jgi:asparagine N-glycosylation enzyme membrane subunit Stt3
LLSGLLALATVSRRGVLMAGAALLVAVGPWGPEFFIQILFFVYAVFLMVLVARQTRAGGSGSNTSVGDNRISSWLSGLRVRFAPSAASAAAAGAVRPRPASSSRYTAPQRKRR